MSAARSGATTRIGCSGPTSHAGSRTFPPCSGSRWREDSCTVPDGPCTSRRCSGSEADVSRSATSTSSTADGTPGRRPTCAPRCSQPRGASAGSASAAGRGSRSSDRTERATSRSRSRWVSSVRCPYRCTPLRHPTRSTRSSERVVRKRCWSDRHGSSTPAVPSRDPCRPRRSAGVRRPRGSSAGTI